MSEDRTHIQDRRRLTRMKQQRKKTVAAVRSRLKTHIGDMREENGVYFKLIMIKKMVITNKIHLENKRYALASGVFFISSLEKSCEIQEVSTIEPATQIQTILLFVYMCFTVTIILVSNLLLCSSHAQFICSIKILLCLNILPILSMCNGTGSVFIFIPGLRKY